MKSKIILTLSALLYVLLLLSCNSGHDYVFNHDNVYVMSLPSQSNQEHFLKKGGVSVVEVKSSKSSESKVQKIAELKYQDLVWDLESGFSKTDWEKMKKSFGSASGSPVLLHSSNSGMAAKALAYYLVKSGKSSVEEALKVAEEAGLPSSEKETLAALLKK